MCEVILRLQELHSVLAERCNCIAKFGYCLCVVCHHSVWSVCAMFRQGRYVYKKGTTSVIEETVKLVDEDDGVLSMLRSQVTDTVLSHHPH